MSSSPSLRDRQIAALKRVFNLNTAVSDGLSEPSEWKVLIFDQHGQDIISPIISVKQLRDLGVTLHLRLHSQRPSIPDVPVVYLCTPSDENLSRIHRDLSERLYDFYHFNFLTPISRRKLEDLAEVALNANCASNIKKIHDQYVQFVSLEEDMFVLRDSDSEKISYYALNRSDVDESEMSGIIDTITEGLFSLCVTMGVVPIIRCSRNNAAEMVGRKLDARLRENLRDARSTLFAGGAVALTDGGGGQFGVASFQRPLLVILDRNLDMATPLHHTWTYQALAHDVLDLKLNRVTVNSGLSNGESEAPTSSTNTSAKTFDLSDSDPFWRTHKGSPFPVVAEAVQEELEKYKASEDQVKNLKQDMGDTGTVGAMANLAVNDNTSKLTSAVTSLPQLLERKRQIDAHTTIATAILDEIKRRRLDTLFEAEEKLLSRQLGGSDRKLPELLADHQLGDTSDALRLFLMHYVTGGGADTELEQCLQTLQERGANLAAYRFLKRWRMYNNSAGNREQFQGSDTKTIDMFSRLVSQGSHFVMEGVKNLVVKKHSLPVTRVVDALMEQKPMAEVDNFCYFDPKLLRSGGASADYRARSAFHEAIVFVVGGGNYIEYQNLVDYAKGKSSSNPRRIVYGSTDLQNASTFLHQLSVMGEGIMQ